MTLVVTSKGAVVLVQIVQLLTVLCHRFPNWMLSLLKLGSCFNPESKWGMEAYLGYIPSTTRLSSVCISLVLCAGRWVVQEQEVVYQATGSDGTLSCVVNRG